MVNMTQIPIGAKLKVLNSDKIVTLEEIRYYPTRYKTKDDSGEIAYYRTHEIIVIESNDET